MTAVSTREGIDFVSALKSNERAPEIPDSSDIYGWLVGSWFVDVFDHLPDGTVRQSEGEVHFGRVLEGRAIQDVWIVPQLSARSTALSQRGNRYGTTLRVWDPALQAWRITWINPVTGTHNELVGRKVGNDLIQIGTEPDGTPIRWSFTEITPDSFRWFGEILDTDGRTWKLECEFVARRMQQDQ